jgi:hypothetical protein
MKNFSTANYFAMAITTIFLSHATLIAKYVMIARV